jgi:hypothetical protein
VSGVYAYCVLPTGRHPPPGLLGLDDRPVVGHEIEGLTTWISQSDAEPALDLDAVERHHRVVESAIAEDVVPLRFGAWQPDLSALEARIRRTRAELEAALELVRGRVEFGVRVREIAASAPAQAEPAVRAQADPAVPAPSGKGYLRALSRREKQRAERRLEQDGLARRIREFLAELVVDERVSYLDAPEVVALAHLVNRPDEPYYQARIRSLIVGEAGGYILHVTGPWPPYSFAAP